MLHRRRLARDEGFSLVEALVALALATTVLTSLAFALAGAVQAGLLSQQNQQAADVLNEAVEQARALPFSQLVMSSTDLDSGEAARTPSLSACQCYNPATDGTSGATEALVPPAAAGGVSPHVTTRMLNAGTFLIRRYVTVPADAAGAAYRRLTVRVEWTSLGRRRVRTFSTLIADARRGLPLPDFKFTGVSALAQCRNPGSDVVYQFQVRNNGARDQWLISASGSPGSWAYYVDSDGDGLWTAADQPVSGSPATPGTGLIEPTAAATFFAVQSLPATASTPTPYTLTNTFRVTSAAQSSFWQELATTTSVQSGPCGSASASPTPAPSSAVSPSPGPSPSPSPSPPAAPAQPAPSCSSLTAGSSPSAPGGGVLVKYYPLNPAQPGNTPAATGMSLLRSGSAPLPTGPLYDYATDLSPNAGRWLSGTGTGLDNTATWSLQYASANQFKGGTGDVTVWAATPDGNTTAAPRFSILVERLSSSGAVLTTLLNTTWTASSGWGCTGFRPFSVPISVSNTGLSTDANDQIRLTVRVTNGVPMRLAYGTAAFPASLTLPYKSGQG